VSRRSTQAHGQQSPAAAPLDTALRRALVPFYAKG